MTDHPLPSSQHAVLTYLYECQRQDVHPTYRELAAHFGWRAVATARDHLRALSAKGLVALGEGRSRNLRITPSGQALFSTEPDANLAPRPEPSPVEGLAQDIIQLLEPYLRKKSFKAGTCLWQEGDPAERCIIIDIGQIMAFRLLPSPWQPWFMDWAFNLSRKGIKLREKWNMIPFGTDILITHSPPHGILDGVRPQPPGWGLESDPGSGPLGCEELAIRLNAVRPKLHVFGHIHDGYGYEERKGTIYVNASICDEKYRPVNQAVIVETDAKASSKRFRLVTQN